MDKIKKYWFIVVFIATLVIPLYGRTLEAKITLSGVTPPVEVVEANILTINDGSYQSYLNEIWENEFPGKKILLKMRNQLLYSVLKVSPNSNVVIGKKGYLYEPAYILFETQAYPPSSEEYFDKLGNNLKCLKQLLEENGKELYVFITPSKAHFYKEYIPASYMFLDNEELYTYTNYSKLLDELNENGINYYDSVAFIEENIESGILQSPLFYASGIHWNHTWGETCAANFLDYMNSCSKYDLGSVSVKESLSKEPISPDTDLYSSLNLILDADEQWYAADMLVENEGTDKPNVFFRGGSFMGQSLNSIGKSGIFEEVVHFENGYYFTDQYTEMETLSSFSAYDELNLNSLLGKSDILVLEVNEGAIHTMSWGFIDYLLEHPEYLNYDTEDSSSEEMIKWNEYGIKIEGAKNTSENPWGYTAGIIEVEDSGECVFITPNTSFTIEQLPENATINIQTEIYPLVADASDGAGILVWILNDAGDILLQDSILIDNNSSWIDIEYSLEKIEGASKIKILCNNGVNDDDSADWVIFRTISTSYN